MASPEPPIIQYVYATRSRFPSQQTSSKCVYCIALLRVFVDLHDLFVICNAISYACSHSVCFTISIVIVLFLPNTPKRRQQNGPKTSARARAVRRISIGDPLFMNCKRWSSHPSTIFPKHLLYWRKSPKSKVNAFFSYSFITDVLLVRVTRVCPLKTPCPFLVPTFCPIWGIHSNL